MNSRTTRTGCAMAAVFCLLAAGAWAYDFRDAIRDSGPDGRGAENIIEFFDYVYQLNDLVGRYVDAANQVDLDFWNPDLSRLYDDPHFTLWENGFHGLSARVNTSPGVISMGFVSREEAMRGHDEQEGYGSFTVQVSLKKSLRPEPRTTSNIVIAEGSFLSAKQDWTNAMRFLEGLLKIIDPDNLVLLRTQAGMDPTAPIDIRDHFWDAFPTYHEKGSGIDVTTRSDLKTVNGKPYNDFTAEIHFRIEALESRFPRVLRYIKQLQNRGYVGVEFKNANDHTLGEVFVDSNRNFLYIKGCSSNGLIIPVDRSSPVFTPFDEEAFSPTKNQRLDWKANVVVFGKVVGIRIRSTNIELAGHYESGENNMRFDVKMKNVPDVYVSGAAFGLFPIWLTDIFMPGTVNGLVRKTFTIMHEANHGDGSMLTVTWRRENPQLAWFHWKAQSEILENDYLLMGSKLLVRYFRMNKKTLAEFNRFFAGELEYVLEDLRGMR